MLVFSLSKIYLLFVIMTVMYTRHSNELKQIIIDARRNGKSIPELVTLFCLPKTTIWHIIKNVAVLAEHVEKLRSKRGGSHLRRLKSIKDAEIEACNLLQGPHREFAVILSMLYWAEGTKRQCAFVNTDGAMIALYLFCIETIFGVSKSDMTFTLRIFGDMNREECLEYWSKIIGIHVNKFIVRLNDGGTNSRKHHGMLSILVLRGHFILKVIQALYRQTHVQLLTKPSLCSSTDRTSPS